MRKKSLAAHNFDLFVHKISEEFHKRGIFHMSGGEFLKRGIFIMHGIFAGGEFLKQR